MADHHPKQNNGHRSMHENQPEVAVVMVPLAAQGHLNQLLHLSRLISAYNIPIYYFTTATHNRQVKARAHGFDTSALTNLHFHDFPTPHFPNLPPNSSSSNSFPSHMIPMMIAILTNIQKPLSTLINELSTKAKRVVVIFDSLMASPVSKAINGLPNVESYCVRSPSAFSTYSFYWKAAGKPVIPQDAAEILEQLPSMLESCGPQVCEIIVSQLQERNVDSGTIFNSNRAIEGVYLDLLSKTRNSEQDKFFALGPFNPVTISEKHDSKCPRSQCLQWLDKQEKNSVIFVSFGTLSFLSNEQVKEIAIGLENSHQKFIWALRDADRGDIFTGEDKQAELPKGFEERVKDRGIIVRDWAPQIEILGHFATGGFLTHCGWNSCMESISMGVPIATWPMHTDQPGNAALLTKVLKIGLEVRDWKQRNELISSVKIGEDVKRLMDSEEGDEMRQRAQKLAEAVKESMMEEGSTRLEMDSFIAHISRHVSSYEV